MREYGSLLRMVGRDQPILSVNGNIAQKEDASFNSKAMNAIFNVVAMEEFKRISNVEVDHTAWFASYA